MKTIRFIILTIPVLGILAGAVGILEGLGITLPEAIGAVVIGTIAISGGRGLLGIFSRFRSQAQETSFPARITGARMGDGVGELTIEAARSSEALALLETQPHGLWIVTIQQNRIYRVDFQAKDKKQLEEVARSNGYRGEIG